MEISAADRIVLILRQRLEAHERLCGKMRGQSTARTAGHSPEPQGIGALLRTDGIDDAVLRRAFLQSLLAEHFGQAFLNDAHFQQVIDQVNRAIAEDPATDTLLSGFLSELRQRTAHAAGG